MNLRELDTITPTPLGLEIERRQLSPEHPREIPDPGRPVRRITAGVVAFVVFGVAIAFVSGVLTDRAAPEPTSEGWSAYPEGWSELPAPPQLRDGAAIVWTGRELLYWGGTPREEDSSRQTSDGFSFDPTTGGWSTIPSAPGTGSDVAPVWTGTEALFVAIDGGVVHVDAFDPTTETWRTLADGPLAPPYGVATAWTGKELILFGGGDAGDPSNREAWSFDPAADDWRHLPDAPIGMNLSDAVWTGREVVVVGSAVDRRNEATTRTAQAQTYDPSSDRWTQLPPPPVSAQTAAVADVAGTLVAWELYGPDSAEWLPAERQWRSLEMGGFNGGECYAEGATTADSLLTWNCGSPAAWFPETGDWVPVDRPIEAESGFTYSFGAASEAGDVAVVDEVETIAGEHGDPYVGSPDAPVHLWVWKPPTVAPVSTWTPKRSDAETLVESFLSDWQPGWDPFLATEATADVLDRCSSGAGGLVALEDGAVRNWNSRGSTPTDQGTFEVTVELIRDQEILATEIFTVGPGTTADGRAGQLLITDVRAA